MGGYDAHPHGALGPCLSQGDMQGTVRISNSLQVFKNFDLALTTCFLVACSLKPTQGKSNSLLLWIEEHARDSVRRNLEQTSQMI